MESLNDIEEQETANQEEQSAETSPKKENFGQKLSKRSPINKFLFITFFIIVVGGLTFVFVVDKVTEFKRVNSADAQAETSTKLTEDGMKAGTEDMVIIDDDHIQAAKVAIEQDRKAALASGIQDSTSSIGDIKTTDAFYKAGAKNTVIGESVGGQSFNPDGLLSEFASQNGSLKNRGSKKNTDDSNSDKTKKSNETKASQNTQENQAEKSKRVTRLTRTQGLAKAKTDAIKDIVSMSETPITPIIINSKGEQLSEGQSSRYASSTPTTTSLSDKTKTPLALESSSGSERSKYNLNSQNVSQLTRSGSNTAAASLVGALVDSGEGTQNQPVQATNTASRGLFMGDKLLAQTTHGLISTSPSMYMIVELIQGPLKGARIIYQPTLSYDTFVYQSSEIQWRGNKAPFTSVLITPDETQNTSYRSGVDYHTLYNLGMVFVSGISQGAAEFVNNVADEIVISDSNTVTTVEFSTEKLIWSALGGVAEAAQPLVDKQLDKAPTVWVDAYDVVGVMMINEWNPIWSPIIDEQTIGIY